MSRLGHFLILVFLHALLILSPESRKTHQVKDNDIEPSNNGASEGKQWAVLVAGQDQKIMKTTDFSVLHDMSKETLKQQYQIVKRRKGYDTELTSHVCRFGSEEMLNDYLASYIGKIPENENFTLTESTSSLISYSGLVNTRDIPLLYLQRMIQKAPMGSPLRKEAQKRLFDVMKHRKQIDQSIIEIMRLSLKQTNVLNLLTSTRTTGQPLVDDWGCFKTLVNSFKNYCGATVDYGLKFTGALANICNMGVDVKQTVSAIEQSCSIK